MPASPSRFGPYEITGPLGAGGMGQVFRARDTRLQRIVAIKILNETGAHDPDRQRRFALEAVAASALNHPNIVTVYDVGVEGDTPYLVSELIDGTSLRAEMDRGRLPLKRFIDIAHQIAEGLAAAHGAGIVHRDLKPENVMVTADGRVKIVDFGLARTDDEETRVSGPTVTETAVGLLVGTVPYMSPEQARGAKADFRSDQFALGVMLYELATGAHPFRRETTVQTLSAIIADDPPDPAQVVPALPVAIRWLLRRLLAKDPRGRYAHTADLAADLRTTREFLSEGSSRITAPVERPRRTWPTRAVATAIAGAGVFFLGYAVGPRDSTPDFDRIVPFATDAGYQGAAAWSPDGKTIAYEAEINGVVQIFTRTRESPMRTQVTRSAFDCYAPFWSADGQHIYYHSLARDRDALWQVSPIGGAPQLVIEGATRAHASPDGGTLVFLRQESPYATHMTLWVVSPPGAEPRRYAGDPLSNRTFSGGQIRFSPDGRRVLAWLGPDGANPPNFWEIPVGGGEPRVLLAGLTGPGRVPPSFSWLPDNRHIVVTRSDGPTPGTHLWLADTTTGSVSVLTTSALNESAPGVSPDGRTIAFDSQATDFDLFEVPLDGSTLRPYLSSTRNEFDPAASPVNTQFAFVTDRAGQLQVWLQNEEGYLQQPIVTPADFGGSSSMAMGSLAFSPDGKRLAFQRTASGDRGDDHVAPRLWISSTAGGTPRPLTSARRYEDAPTWSPDGDWIAYISSAEDGQGAMVLAKSRVGSEAPPVTLLRDIPPFVSRPQWSPDGESIVCETADGLALVAADGSRSRIIGDTGWFAYAWGRDGRSIYGLRPTDDQHHFMFVSLDVQTGRARVINANLGTIPQASQPIRGFSRLHGRGFLTSIARVRSDIHFLEGFRLPPTLRQRLWPFQGPAR
ncbi:MAG TPA: protein kinase [Vicinamibacterales bacterium]|nr:protein kinase [Vicinamibacterales bacterium]